jgi:hypothetical protein
MKRRPARAKIIAVLLETLMAILYLSTVEGY